MTMFQPEEIIFAPTGRCNLRCPHCRVTRGPSEIEAADAVAFLDTCADAGIERVGFSGGEPFLRLDFLVAVTKAAVSRGLFFDRLMTNGDWWIDEAELEAGLGAVFDAGFDGVIGLSWDAYHGQAPARARSFIQALASAWGRKDAVEILSVRSPDDLSFLRDLEAVASGLGGRVEKLAGEPARIVDEAFSSRSESDPDDGSGLNIQVQRFGRSRSAAEGASGMAEAWGDASWFVDDLCAGPGNVFYVHPDGSVAPCCGFANESAALKLGTVRDSYERLMENAQANSQVRACFDEGLGSVRKRLEASGTRFPGKTRDICFFCEHLCNQPGGMSLA